MVSVDFCGGTSVNPGDCNQYICNQWLAGLSVSMPIVHVQLAFDNMRRLGDKVFNLLLRTEFDDSAWFENGGALSSISGTEVYTPQPSKSPTST